ncbi:30S ribosomal protein S17 [Candidatus Dependentiae bacterium]|nr:30S ribosomal protein S17 [Candidatus Dependentiae bacterium]
MDTTKSSETKRKRVLEGEVVSDKMQKTVVVKVTRRFKHPLLGKTVQKSKKYKVHDEQGTAHVGDWVEIAESRPLSKTKHMVLSRIIRQAD